MLVTICACRTPEDTQPPIGQQVKPQKPSATSAASVTSAAPESAPKVVARPQPPRVKGEPSVDLVTDCNISMRYFGMLYKGVDFHVRDGSGLARVGSAIQSALYRQPEFTAGGSSRICGFANKRKTRKFVVDCDSRSFAEACKSFLVRQNDSGVGQAIAEQLRKFGVDSAQTTVMLTHGLPSARGARLDEILGQLGAQQIGRQIARGELSFAFLHLNEVPYGRSTYPATKKLVPVVDGQRVAALGVIVFGPANPLTQRLIADLLSELKRFNPSWIQLSAPGGGASEFLLEEVKAQVTAKKGVRSGECRSRAGEVVSCALRLPPDRAGRHPQRELVTVDLTLRRVEHGRNHWTPSAAVAAPEIQMVAKRSTAKQPTAKQKAVFPVVAQQLDDAADHSVIRLGSLRPTGDCKQATSMLKRQSKKWALGVDDPQATRRLAIPVRCLMEGTRAGQRTASSLEITATPTLEKLDPNALNAAMIKRLDELGFPDTSKAGAKRVIGARQIIRAIASATARAAEGGALPSKRIVLDFDQ